MTDEGREEAYAERLSDVTSDAIVSQHRYSPEQNMTERQLDTRARMAAMQEMADQGRPVHSIPWFRKAQQKSQVKHRQWPKRSNGWSHCRRCGHAVPTSDDGLKIQHQEEHAERDRVLTMQAQDFEHMTRIVGDLQAQLDVAGEEITSLQLRLDALLLTLGHPDQDALQAVVEQVMSIARQVNARRESHDE